jgi:phosphoglycolate phosphatase-like HAD superfamily hydrolase
MPKYDVLILDVDGTFINSYPDFLKCMIRLAERNSWPTDERVTTAIGQNFGVPTDAFARACWPDADIDLIVLQAALDRFNEEVLPPLFVGALEVFDALKRDLHICTGRLRSSVMPLLAHHEIGHHFIRIVTRSDVKRCKPHPEGIERIIVRAQDHGTTERERFLMVGDSWESDGKCASAAGIDFLAVAESGHVSRRHFRERGIEDSMIIDRFRDLPDWLLSR